MPRQGPGAWPPPPPHITRPHSRNTSVLPLPALGPDAREARVSGPRAYPREAHGARARGSRGLRGLRRGAAPALGSPGRLLLVVLGPAPAARQLQFPPQQPVGRHRGARGGARLRRLLLLLPARQLGGPGVPDAGVVGVLGALGLPPVRSPSPRGVSLASRGRHGLGARGGGGRVGRGATGGGAAGDAGSDAGAAARPLAMAPRRAGGSHLPFALPSPPDARQALPFPGPARHPAPPPAGCPPGCPTGGRVSAPGASPAAALGPPLRFCPRLLGTEKTWRNTWVGKSYHTRPERLTSRCPSRISLKGRWDSQGYYLP